MAIVSTDSRNYENIATAIREESGSESKFAPPEMPAAIKKIKSTWLNDSIISENTVWSSLNIVKQTADRLASPFNKKAPLVQGEFVADYPMTVKSCIEPVQEGASDPSPENVRPIHGVTEVKAVRCGKNLCSINEGGGNIFKIQFDGLIPPGEYTVSAITKTTSPTAKHVGLIALIGNKNVSYTGVKLSAKGENAFGTLQVKEPADRLWIYSHDLDFTESQKYSVNVAELQMTQVTDGAPYEPYRGQTFTQTLSEEIFGGVYEWDTGKLTVTATGLVFDGSDDEKWFFEGKYFVAHSPLIKKARRGATGYCNREQYKFGYTLDAVFAIDNLIYAGEALTKKYSDDLQLWKKSLQEIPMQVVYAIAEPYTIQLPKHLLLSLPGVTTVYGSTAQLEVTARLDPNAERKALEKRIAALEKAHTPTI